MRSLRFPTWWGGVLPTVVLPVVLAVVTLAGTGVTQRVGMGLRPLDGFGVFLLLAGPALLVVRRWNSPAVLAGVGGVMIGYLAAGYAFGPVPLATFVALGTTVALGYRRAGYALAACVFAAVVVVHLLRYPESGFPFVGVSLWLAWVAAFVAAVELWRSRRDRREQARMVTAEADRRRESEERVRIARDLHDVLGHHVSLINVQAGVALYLMDDDPEQARAALTAIKQSSRDLLQEMRSTLGVLRGVDEEPPLHAVAGLAQMDDLVEATRTAGLPVMVEIGGEPQELSPSVDTAAYRIMQEALTNTRKHAGAARATVLLTYTAGGLDMRIDDNGAGPAATMNGGGNGLPGMRERAASLGGTVSAGPRPGGGFRVDVHLPTGRRAR